MKYSSDDLRAAVGRVLKDGWSTYKASKNYNVPFNTLKRYLCESSGSHDVVISKKGRPLALTVEEEQKLMRYIIKMQELGFGLSASEVRREAFKLINASGRKNPFNTEEGIAGWDWWCSFKDRYGLAMRLPENLSVNRAAAASKESIDEFYGLLTRTLEKHHLSSEPSRIWNVDESGFTFVNKAAKVVSPRGLKRVHQQTAAEREETTTVLLAVNAAGQAGPCLTIFKGRRMADDINQNAPVGSMVCVSPNGWINSDIFLRYMQHFEKNIPAARPVVVILDAHASYMSVDVLNFIEAHGIIFLTFPSHTRHLLQPLDVSVFGPMKNNWKKSVTNFLKNNSRKPTRKDLFALFTPVFQDSVTIKNIISGFRHSGIFPLNRQALAGDLYHSSELHTDDDAKEDPSGDSLCLPQKF